MSAGAAAWVAGVALLAACAVWVVVDVVRAAVRRAERADRADRANRRASEARLRERLSRTHHVFLDGPPIVLPAHLGGGTPAACPRCGEGSMLGIYWTDGAEHEARLACAGCIISWVDPAWARQDVTAWLRRNAGPGY